MDLRNQFVSLVAQSRGMPFEKVSVLADGRVFTGREARSLGLIDEIGDERAAREWIRKRLKLPKNMEVREMESPGTRLFKVFGKAQERLFVSLVAAASPRAYLY